MTLFDRAMAHKIQADREREEANARAHAEAITSATSQLKLLLRTILKTYTIPEPTDISTSPTTGQPSWVSMAFEIDGIRFYGTHNPSGLTSQIKAWTTNGDLVDVQNLYQLAELIEQGRIAPAPIPATTHERFAR